MRPALAALLIGIAALNFAWMPGEFLGGDPYAWREETRSLLLAGELNVPTETARDFGERGMHFVLNEHDGLRYVKYGIANSLLALPPMWLDRALGGNIEERRSLPSLLLYNLWYLALGVALAALLYALSGHYARRTAVRVLFVVCAFYCTSLWFYLRAQSSELHQTLFFTALFMALIGFLRPLRERGPGGLDRRAWACLAGVWVFAALLFFTRVLYGLLFPLITLLAAWCAAGGRPWREARRGAPALATALLLPPLLMIALLGFVNQVKFGAPWLTGYHQWKTEMHLPVGRLADGLFGFLFSPRFSIFFYFPLLVFAVVALRRFTERHRLDAVVMLSIFGAFLLWLAKTPSWAGEWTYGPRYLLPMLPVLSLPFLTFADDVLERIATWRARGWAAAAIALLAYSAYLQVQVTRTPFWTFYNARMSLDAFASTTQIDYFYFRNDGTVVDELLRHRDNLEALPYYAELKTVVPPEFLQLYGNRLGSTLDSPNLYWALPPEKRR
jgi:hypothetical protein